MARVNGDGTPNLKETTRALMAQMEEDLGTRLDWVAVDHFDTAYPHTHIIARDVTHDSKGLNIAGEYISRGIRERLEEELTRELGWKSELQIQREMTREVGAMRVTTADRHIADGMDKERTFLASTTSITQIKDNKQKEELTYKDDET